MKYVLGLQMVSEDSVDVGNIEFYDWSTNEERTIDEQVEEFAGENKGHFCEVYVQHEEGGTLEHQRTIDVSYYN